MSLIIQWNPSYIAYFTLLSKCLPALSCQGYIRNAPTKQWLLLSFDIKENEFPWNPDPTNAFSAAINHYCLFAGNNNVSLPNM